MQKYDGSIAIKYGRIVSRGSKKFSGLFYYGIWKVNFWNHATIKGLIVYDVVKDYSRVRQYENSPNMAMYVLIYIALFGVVVLTGGAAPIPA